MERGEIIKQLKKYFKLSELVCPHILNRFGDTAWMFLSTQILHTLLVLRTEIINKPLIINSGTKTQRGMRNSRYRDGDLRLSPDPDGPAWETILPGLPDPDRFADDG